MSKASVSKRPKPQPLTAKKETDPGPPRSLAIFEKGIATGNQFAAGMSALMTDVISGSVTPQIANAVCNAGGKLLKVVEMSHRWGKRSSDAGGERILQLSD